MPLVCRFFWMVLIVAPIALALREQRGAADAQEQRDGLRKLAAELRAEVDQAEKQRQDAARQVDVAKDRPTQNTEEEQEIVRLRAELAQAPRPIAAAPLNKADVLTARVARLRQQLIADKQDDKLTMLTEQDWMECAIELESDMDDAVKKAAADLIWRAKTHFAAAALSAIEQFSQEHGGQWPDNIHQIKTLMPEPAASMVDSFQIAEPGTVHPPTPGPKDAALANQWALVEKTAAALPSQMRITIYPGGYFGQGGP